jgi:osmotically-inducible protein OsmY
MKHTKSMVLAVSLLAAAPVLVGCAPERTVGQTVSDSAITARVKSELLADPDVSGLNVNVTTYQGQVQLSGYVTSEEQRAQAEQIARSVDGVKSVSNDLIVKSAQQQ